MNLNNKKLFYLSLFYAIYQVVIEIVMGSFRFLESDLNYLIYLFLILCSSGITLITYLKIGIKTNQKIKTKKAILYSSFLTSSLVSSSLIWLIFSHYTNFFIYISSFLITAFLPTVIIILFFIYKATQEHFIEMSNVSLKKNDADTSDSKLFHLENANGKILLEVPIKKIVCFEANDNYVVTYFLSKENEINKSMERISLKKIEEMLTNEQVSFYRVHKSYLINPDFVEDVKGRSQAYKIKMKFYSSLVPVSRSYDINEILKYQ